MKLVYFALCLLLSTACTYNRNESVTATDSIPNNIKNIVEVVDTVTIATPKSEFIQKLEDQGLVRILDIDPTVQIDLKYATNDNFTGKILYDELNEGYLHPISASKLAKAQQLLKEIDANLSLLVYDAVRPLSIQKKMYEVVQSTKYQAYVANPSRTSLHNYGIAVDLTLCNSEGIPLDMGTPFDFFGRAAGINQEDDLIRQGILTKQQVNNRKLLRKVMTEAGFSSIRGEWWHFNGTSLSEAKKNITLIE